MEQNLLNTAEMSEEEAIKAAGRSPVQNPCSGAITYGLSGAACVALGAVIRKNSVHDEAMTVLYGGLVTGAIVGLVGMVFLMSNPRSLVKYDSLLQCAAYFSAPAMGLVIVDYDITYTQLLIDSLVGGCIVFGGTCILVISCLLPLLSATGINTSSGGQQDLSNQV